VSTTDRTDDFENTLSFDAFGRRFVLALKKNRRLRRHVADGNIELLRGKVAGAPRSWVRLMRRGDEISGMIRTADDVYVIEPRTRIVDSLLDPDFSRDATNIIYRLADAMIPPAALTCGALSGIETKNAQTAFDAIVTELGDAPTLNAIGATRRITVGALGDFQLFSQLQGQTEASILERFNVVDGIYTNELGIEIAVDDVTIFSSPRFSATTAASDLLDEVGAYRSNINNNQLRFGLTHLVTGRQLDNNIAGIAFVGQPGTFGACTASGAGLTEDAASTTFAALLIAHEIGHNFGAAHDGEPGSPCATTPTDFLMAATIDGSSDEFSTCSKNTMQPVIDAASCLTAVAIVDLELSPPLESPTGAELRVASGGEFTLSYEILNTGTGSATDIVAQFTIPSSFTMAALTAPGGTCDPIAGRCTIGSLGIAAMATVVATLSGDSPGSFQVDLSITAPDEFDTTDNLQSIPIAVVMQPDLRVNLSGPTTLPVGESRAASVTIENNSSTAASDVQIDLSSTAGLRITNLTSPNADVLCTATSCNVASLSGLGTIRIDLTLTADTASTQTVTAETVANQWWRWWWCFALDGLVGADTGCRFKTAVASRYAPVNRLRRSGMRRYPSLRRH